jgi:hypothetical protein
MAQARKERAERVKEAMKGRAQEQRKHRQVAQAQAQAQAQQEGREKVIARVHAPTQSRIQAKAARTAVAIQAAPAPLPCVEDNQSTYDPHAWDDANDDGQRRGAVSAPSPNVPHIVAPSSNGWDSTDDGSDSDSDAENTPQRARLEPLPAACRGDSSVVVARALAYTLETLPRILLVLLGQQVQVADNRFIVRSITDEDADGATIVSELVTLAPKMEERRWVSAMAMVLADPSNNSSENIVGVFNDALLFLRNEGSGGGGGGDGGGVGALNEARVAVPEGGGSDDDSDDYDHPTPI